MRLFNILLYASLTTKYAPLRTPAGLTQLVMSGAMTEDEREALLEASTGYNAILLWITATMNAAFADGRLGGGNAAHASGLSTVLLGKVSELRATASSISDKLSGRMPLAYTQLVQILCDLFVLTSPLALMHSVGPIGAITGTALVTFFHRSVLNLAKVLLDPFGNMEWNVNSGISINVATLIQVRAARPSPGWAAPGARAPAWAASRLLGRLRCFAGCAGSFCCGAAGGRSGQEMRAGARQESCAPFASAPFASAPFASTDCAAASCLRRCRATPSVAPLSSALSNVFPGDESRL